MIIAELRNKLSGDGIGLTDRSEDLLTSTVFGLLRYLPADAVLFRWLRGAKPLVDGGRPLIAGDAVEARLEFWPRVREREMDLSLVARGPSGEEIVGIECKLGEGPSPAEPRPNLPERTVLLRRGNQLADYWDAIRHDELHPISWTVSEKPPRALLYLTADLVCPTDALEDALEHIRPEWRDEAARAFHWIHWQALPEVLRAFLAEEGDAYRRQVAADLLALLERKSLAHFRGFSVPEPVSGSVVFRRLFDIRSSNVAAPRFYVAERRSP